MLEISEGFETYNTESGSLAKACLTFVPCAITHLLSITQNVVINRAIVAFAFHFSIVRR